MVKRSMVVGEQSGSVSVFVSEQDESDLTLYISINNRLIEGMNLTVSQLSEMAGGRLVRISGVLTEMNNLRIVG